jgi:hypothetical protein
MILAPVLISSHLVSRIWKSRSSGFAKSIQFCEEHFDSRKTENLTPFVILTGPPGIGES